MTREVLAELDRRMAGHDPGRIAELFAETVDWDIPGDTTTVPWIGKRTTRAEVREFLADLDRYLERDVYEVERTFVDGEQVVRTGRLRSRVRSTGRWIETRFAIEMTVTDGLITRYHLHEDSWHVAEATRG
ncbi:nuclear transport factor 2 family protein [Amycolatopsis magusensis]|uniref:nuclear transport factor 2 family protein n=1 Tax=Amycolatopsis magusensis TaxID=882444 RepID=UPI003C2C37B9